jgi:hypothetical protein
MPRSILPLILLLLLLVPAGVDASQSAPAVQVRSPAAGQALQGIVPVYMLEPAVGFVRAEISFTYSSDLTNTWFLIAELDEAPAGDKLIDWDTTTLTDGNYTLRLTIWRENGHLDVIIIPGLRVRNYTPIETPTPTSSPTAPPLLTPSPTLVPTPTLTPIPPTATPVAKNPAQLLPLDIPRNMGRGALGVLAFFALMGGYASARRLFRR